MLIGKEGLSYVKVNWLLLKPTYRTSELRSPNCAGDTTTGSPESLIVSGTTDFIISLSPYEHRGLPPSMSGIGMLLSSFTLAAEWWRMREARLHQLKGKCMSRQLFTFGPFTVCTR